MTSGDGIKTVHAQYKDASNNTSDVYTDEIELDTIQPTGSIVINGGAGYTASTAVSLSLSANDSGSGVARMRFSNDNSVWSDWAPYAAYADWTLAPGDGSRTVYVEYQDTAGNDSTVYSDTITVDSSGATGGIVINGGAEYSRYTSVSLGLSSPGAAQMRFSNDNVSWTGWEGYSSAKSWSLSGDGPKVVLVQYKDGAGVSSGIYSDAIYLDGTSPSGILAINDGDVYTSSTSADLTLVGVDFDSGMYQMKVSNNGITWSGWEAYAPSKSWTLTSGDGTKTVYVKYKDQAGNTSFSISDTIQLESNPPSGSISINSGDDLTNTPEVVLSLSATDSESGVSQMRLSDSLPDWNAWELYAPERNWTLSSGDGTKTVYAQYQDGAGNTSPVYSDTIELNTDVIAINGGADYTRYTAVTLTLSYVNGVEMRFSNDSVNWSGWESYSTSRAWTLSSGDGTRTVYVQYKDGSATVSPSYSDSIVLDTTLPTGTITIDDGALYTGTTQVTLTLSASDAGSGVAQMKFSNNNVTWGAWQSYSTSASWTLESGYGEKTVHVKYKDSAGNTSWSASDDIELIEHADVTIAQAKELADGERVGLASKTVTAVFADSFYIQEPDRTAGIMVKPASAMPPGLAIGALVEVMGTLNTDSDGERYIEAQIRTLN